ncbi:efflux RND transporter periplasmic adaptor subunit [Desulfosarcina ovata]|uniref:Uncharacterized protein n=1 Tax=Desulfosarcina ovata subsp. ovata TaxID=2752305 RepID=A0A5K8AJI1_9BACT|nr:efflux RND transporter periplasmic adaptor subunit [Desulfosarcina ovata]BBO92669.1 hypothetical protein DSCOOX_58490 [Desulfosarcina ovata subsp. ovata]
MKTLTKRTRIKKSLVLAIALMVGAGLGYGLNGNDADSHTGQEPMHPPHDGHPVVQTVHAAQMPGEMPEAQALYICPMNCVPPMEKPGKCPVCGMDLVAMVTTDHRHADKSPQVTFRPQQLHQIGVRTAPVARKFVTAKIKLYGKIEYDPVEQYKVTAFAPGIIDRIYVKRAGQTVRRGDPLFDMHSSELFVLEQDLFEVLKAFPDPVDFRPARGQIYKRQMRPPRRQFSIPRTGEAPAAEIAAKTAALEKLAQIKRKMRLLGLTEENIERVMARGLPSGISTVITPTTGVVQEQFAFKGAYVNTGETVFTVANPEYTWARLEGYATDFPWVRLGQEAEFTVDAYPGEIFKGKVLYLDTEFDPRTRTFEVGVLYTDKAKRLKPNMLVRCVIHSTLTADGAAAPGEESAGAPLVIPDTAPLITGNRAVVYVEDPGKSGTYEGREVLLGPRASDYYVVRQGLMEGETVVTNGNFKIDSAVQILAKPSMMEQGAGRRAMMGMHAGHAAMPAMAMPTTGKVETEIAGSGLMHHDSGHQATMAGHSRHAAAPAMGMTAMGHEDKMEPMPSTAKGISRPAARKPSADRYRQIKARLEKLKKEIR